MSCPHVCAKRGTVLHFLGNANRNFRFDRRYRAILGGTDKEIEGTVKEYVPFLPPGCSIRLDRLASPATTFSGTRTFELRRQLYPGARAFPAF